jgi:hypothetical protein
MSCLPNRVIPTLCFRSAEVRGCCAAVQVLSGSLSCWNAGSHASSSIQQPHRQDTLLLGPFQGFAANYAKGKGGLLAHDAGMADAGTALNGPAACRLCTCCVCFSYSMVTQQLTYLQADEHAKLACCNVQERRAASTKQRRSQRMRMQQQQTHRSQSLTLPHTRGRLQGHVHSDSIGNFDELNGYPWLLLQGQ